MQRNDGLADGYCSSIATERHCPIQESQCRRNRKTAPEALRCHSLAGKCALLDLDSGENTTERQCRSTARRSLSEDCADASKRQRLRIGLPQHRTERLMLQRRQTAHPPAKDSALYLQVAHRRECPDDKPGELGGGALAGEAWTFPQDCHSAAPFSTLSRCISRDPKGVSVEWQSRRWRVRPSVMSVW